MKHQHLKNILSAIVVCTLLAGVLALAGCAGRGTLSSDIIEETGAYKVVADDAAKDAAVMASGAVIVEEGQVVVISPDLTKGSLKVKFMDAANETVFDEKVGGRVLSTYEFAPGEYAIAVTCLENGTTGSLVVASVDADEFEKQNQDLEKALALAGVARARSVAAQAS